MFDIFAESREQARSEAIPWGELEGKCVLITGATGLIGFACARLLLERNRLGLGPQIRVLCLVRNEERAREIFSAYGEDDGLEMVVGSVEDFPQPEGSIDYIVHTACPTASKFFAEHPVETADALVLGTRRVLELARAKGVSGMVYASSMEAYGDGNAEPGLDNLLNESQVGYVDPLRVRSCYPEGKRMCECLCAAYAHEYQLPVKIARLAQTFGAGVSISEGRVFAQFARSLMKGEDIVLHTEGKSYGNYCATCDCVRGLLTILLRGVNGEAYNVANEKTNIRIRDMAQMIADQSGGKIQVRFDIPKDALQYGYAPDVKMRLSGDKLRGLGWEPELDLPQMYQRLIASWQAQEAAANKGENA